MDMTSVLMDRISELTCRIKNLEQRLKSEIETANSVDRIKREISMLQSTLDGNSKLLLGLVDPLDSVH